MASFAVSLELAMIAVDVYGADSLQSICMAMAQLLLALFMLRILLGKMLGSQSFKPRVVALGARAERLKVLSKKAQLRLRRRRLCRDERSHAYAGGAPQRTAAMLERAQGQDELRRPTPGASAIRGGSRAADPLLCRTPHGEAGHHQQTIRVVPFPEGAR